MRAICPLAARTRTIGTPIVEGMLFIRERHLLYMEYFESVLLKVLRSISVMSGAVKSGTFQPGRCELITLKN